MGFKQRNRGIPIPQPAREIKSLFFVVIFLFLLLIGGSVFGASPFTDDFEDYIVGDLSGQGGWTTTTPYNSWQVSTTTTEVGEYSIGCFNGYCANTKSGDPVSNGIWVFYTYATTTADFGFWIKEGTSDICRVDLSSAQTIQYYGDSGWVDTGWPVIYNQYQPLQIEWDATLDQCRVQYATTTWSSWFDAYNNFIYIDALNIVITNTANLERFIDYISDTLSFPCDSDHCGYCDESTTCISAGCSWSYSVYLQEYFCGTYYSPDPDICGSFFKCQYCDDQSTCEAELNCQWTDIGYGDRCYMIEPTIPPDQVDWELPEIDDCASETGIIAWLCEIKNFIAGIFMPTQEKIETLYQTVGAFKEKFPFNYLSLLSGFFSDISDDLQATKTIPVEILGATSTVNFGFWNSTTSIGGQEETFKNMLYDFTTFVVLMGWFVWFISIIKRFF